MRIAGVFTSTFAFTRASVLMWTLTGIRCKLTVDGPCWEAWPGICHLLLSLPFRERRDKTIRSTWHLRHCPDARQEHLLSCQATQEGLQLSDGNESQH